MVDLFTDERKFSKMHSSIFVTLLKHKKVFFLIQDMIIKPSYYLTD